MDGVIEHQGQWTSNDLEWEGESEREKITWEYVCIYSKINSSVF